jgi:glycosyltransferase involved in cell wall biosynthesis
VIPALNEVDTLDELLDDCAALDPGPDEVVVVDAGSTDGTAELLARRASEWPSLTVLTAPSAGPGRARNEGISATGAPLLITVDCGTRIPSGWLGALRERVRQGPRRLAAGIPATDAHTPFEEAAGWLSLRGFKPSGAPRTRAPFRPSGRNGYCFPREAWEAVGGFPDLRFDEDKLFVDRVRAAGYEIVAAPDAVIRWRPRASLRDLYRQYRAYGRGDVVTGIDVQHELIPLALYGTGTALAARAAGGSHAALVALACSSAAYLGLYAGAAARDGEPGRAVAWIPIVRVTMDVAKIHGLIDGVRERLRQRG